MVDPSDASDADGKSTAGSLRCDQRDVDVDFSDIWSVENGNTISRNKDEMISMFGREHEDFDSSFGYTGGSQRLLQIASVSAPGNQEEMEDSQRIPGAVAEDVCASTSNHPDEGPSLGTQTDQDGSGRILHDEDRAMLLRKLDELTEELRRSCDVVDKPKDTVSPSESFIDADSWFPHGFSGSQKPPSPLYGPDKHAARAGPSYFSHFPEPFAYPLVGNEMTQGVLYPPIRNRGHILAYGDAFGPQVLGRISHQFHGEYQQQPPHPYFSGQHIESNYDPFVSYPQSSVLHHASCSCFHCYEKHQRVPPPVPPSVFCHRRISDMPGDPMYLIENPKIFNSSRTTMLPPLNVHGKQEHTRWPKDINSEIGHFVRGHPQRVVLASGGRRLRPIAGGAPFLTCSNCFELLKMPRKVQFVVKKEEKLCCGACSTVINFTVNKSRVLHDHAKTNAASVEADDFSNDIVNDCSSHFHGHMNRISANFSSDDYGHSGFEFQSIDREQVALSKGQALNSVKPQEMQGFHSSSPSISEDENTPDFLISSREEVKPVQQPINSILPPPPAGSPLQEHFDYSTKCRAVNRLEKGNHSTHYDHDNVVPNKALTLPTEIEVLSNEYSATGISQDSGSATGEADKPKMAEGGEPFLANIINTNFKDSSKVNKLVELEKRYVSVNGHELPELVVKEAEKMAGRIRSGQYWYDFRAGFWGVLGGPCLGIIPCIEEFNYPMPDNCSGGTTGVIVNGRELHQKDLELLAKRGLPTDRDRYYIIEMSGRVLDVDTGEELYKLGKLAPTVEKAKHGFGMKVRRAAAQ